MNNRHGGLILKNDDLSFWRGGAVCGNDDVAWWGLRETVEGSSAALAVRFARLFKSEVTCSGRHCTHAFGANKRYPFIAKSLEITLKKTLKYAK